MKDLPNPFWALMFALLGSALIIAALYHSGAPIGVLMAVTTAGSSLISGAFGYINGHKDGANSVTVPLSPSTSASTTVTVDPTMPATPAITKD